MPYDNNYYSYMDVIFLCNVYSNFKVIDPFLQKLDANKSGTNSYKLVNVKFHSETA